MPDSKTFFIGYVETDFATILQRQMTLIFSETIEIKETASKKSKVGWLTTKRDPNRLHELEIWLSGFNNGVTSYRKSLVVTTSDVKDA